MNAADERREQAVTSARTRLVTVSASYGAGGSVVAPALAQRLGVPFLQRATTGVGAPTGPEPCDERLAPDEADSTPVHRLLASFTHAMPAAPPSHRRRPAIWTSTCAAAARRASVTWPPPARA